MPTKKQQALLKHELLDRAYTSFQAFETFIMDHPGLKNNEKLSKKAKKLHKKLFDFYQEAGNS